MRDLDGLISELDSLTFPATGSEVVAEIGDHEVNTVHGSYTIAELVPNANAERFDSPADEPSERGDVLRQVGELAARNRSSSVAVFGNAEVRHMVDHDGEEYQVEDAGDEKRDGPHSVRGRELYP